MNSNNENGTSYPENHNQKEMASKGDESLSSHSNAAVPDWVNPVADDETTVLSREKLTTQREDAVNLREDMANRRERVALAREKETCAREVCVAEREQEVCAADALQTASNDHINMLQQANARLVVATIEAHKLAEQVQAVKTQLDHLAHHDVLTDLPNRVLLQDRLIQAIELAHRQKRQLAVLYMDLDQFKYINDSLGHAIGDQLLQSVAQRLLTCVRRSDTVSRQGGDEFVLLLPFIEKAEDAVLTAQKILTTLAQPHTINQHDLHISVSIGISIYPNDGLDPETLIKSADTAMYYAKERGRNNYKFFKQDMNDRAVLRQSIEANLRSALVRQEFMLYYQPKVNLHSGAIVGAEALIRWQHPQRGLLLPAQFVSVAEDSGLILPIGRWVLYEACRQAQTWRQSGLPPIKIAVNTSALEFRAKDFLDNIHTALQDTCLEPSNLELELTESILMRDAKVNNSVLHTLAELGVKLAVDDFGTGYSSLSYLRQFPINTLKIDQSFVNQITNSPDDASIVTAVISLGKSLKQCVIAEGVETAEQYAFLLAHHCDEGQGYYFGLPMPADKFTKLLEAGISKTLLLAG